MKRHLIVLCCLFILCVLFIFCYNFFFTNITEDEIWVYGFSYNISIGRIPYRDFNMIVNPFYSFLGSGMIQIFGKYLWALYILDALLVAGMMLFLFKMIGFRAFLVYPFIILWAIPSYNLFCLFWLFLILFFILQLHKFMIYLGRNR